MKKGLILFVIALLLAALAFGAITFLNYKSVDTSNVPFPDVRVMEHAIQPISYQWRVPVMGGLLHVDLIGDGTGPTELGVFVPGTTFIIEPPAGLFTTIALTCNGDEVLNTTLDAPLSIEGETTAQAGEYLLTLLCQSPEGQHPQGDGAGFGFFHYTVRFIIEEPVITEPAEPEAQRPAQPTLLAPNTNLQQGDVLSLQVMAAPGEAPSAETNLGMAIFTPLNELGDWYCTIPIGNTQALGEYPVTVTAAGLTWTLNVNVEAFPFIQEELTIDVSDPVIGEANSPAAYAQYREKIPPLFSTFDEERYWSGLFVQPTEGRISTQFGSIRITNGNTANPSIHWGMDIAAAEGTPVVAPGAGRVVLAERLLNTGNTLVIEHGGGLKSYYFHMSELAVATGDMVETGQRVGAVGSTGYSTGPHLHFEMRIGNAAINPQLLFSEDSGLYSAETYAEENTIAPNAA